ncbi:MAG: helix-turn-helix transcriptional regulator [Azospirillum sp.]|nr:helix-turn-helix transcriptional regulator [Azospirillum sp.]
MDLEKLAETIKAARKRAGLSQAALAQRANVSISRLDAIENNRFTDVGIIFVTKVAQALDLELFLDNPRSSRPTLDDLRSEKEQSNAPRMG